MSGHTPGPWRIDPDCPCDVQTSDGLREVATTALPYSIPLSEQIANARLIAAAPSMLAALQGLMEMLGPWETQSPNPQMRAAITIARNAIAKAKGGGE